MADKFLCRFAHGVRLADADGVTDVQLLQRFTLTHDEGAFAMLVRRYGSLVLAVAKRVLGNLHDAEDVFQATFLVLARKAATIRQHDSLSSWLYCVAFRAAQEARDKAVRRRFHERRTVLTTSTTPQEEPPTAEASGLEEHELTQALSEEVSRLPEKLRAPVILCYYEGRSSEQAAQSLGCPAVTIRTRLVRARDRMRRRLSRRGLVLASAPLAALLVDQVARAKVPLQLTLATSRAAVSYAIGETVLREVAPQVVALANSGLRALALARGKSVMLVLLLASVLGTGATGLAYRPHEPIAAAPVASIIAEKPLRPAAPQLPAGAVLRVGRPHHKLTAAVNAVLFTPDGKRVATAEADGTVHLWEAASQQLIGVCAQHPGGLCTAAFTPDGATLATAGKDGTVRLWDVATGAERAVCTGHREAVTALAVAPNGQTLASGGRDRTIRLWDVATGKEQFAAVGHESEVVKLTFSADGKRLASSSADRTVRLWDPVTGREEQTIRDASSAVRTLAFAPDGRKLAFGEDGGKVHVRDLATDADRQFSIQHGLTGGVPAALIFSLDGRSLTAWSRSDARGHVWDLETGQEKQFSAGVPVLTEPCTAWSPDGKTLAWSVGAGGFRLRDAATGEERVPPGSQRSPASRIALAPDGRTLATTDGSVIHLWDSRTGRERHVLPGHPSGVDALAFAPDGQSLASAAGGGSATLRLWSVATGAVIWTLPLPPSCTIESLAFSPDGRILARAQYPNTQAVRICDAATGENDRAFGSDKAPPGLLLFSPDGAFLLVAGRDNTVRVWDATSGQALHAYPGHATSNFPVAFAPDGKTIASGLKSLELRNVTTAELLQRCTGPWGEITAVAFSPNGKVVASGGGDGVVRLWDTATGRELRSFTGPPGRVAALAFAADGQSLASSAADTTVLIWRCTKLSP